MFHSLNALLAPALLQRLTLLLNHVLAAETVATDRLRPHSGARVVLTLQGWPALLPTPPLLAWRITPAGLLDACTEALSAAPELALNIDASNPAALLAGALAGQTPAVQIDGSAQLAGDVNWLMQNLRWDLAGDIEQVLGPTAAQALLPLGRMLAQGLQAALKAASALSPPWRAKAT